MWHPFLHRKSMGWLLNITTVPHVDHYESQAGIVKTSMCFYITALKQSKGKYFLIKGPEKQMPQWSNCRKTHLQLKTPVMFTEGKPKLNSKRLIK